MLYEGSKTVYDLMYCETMRGQPQIQFISTSFKLITGRAPHLFFLHMTFSKQIITNEKWPAKHICFLWFVNNSLDV